MMNEGGVSRCLLYLFPPPLSFIRFDSWSEASSRSVACLSIHRALSYIPATIRSFTGRPGWFVRSPMVAL